MTEMDDIDRVLAAIDPQTPRETIPLKGDWLGKGLDGFDASTPDTALVTATIGSEALTRALSRDAMELMMKDLATRPDPFVDRFRGLFASQPMTAYPKMEIERDEEDRSFKYRFYDTPVVYSPRSMVRMTSV